MTKTRSTKRALLVSLLALLTCVSMLVGSTFAWFTDSVTTAGNKIVAGTLQVDLQDANSNSLENKQLNFVQATASGTTTVTTPLWEPGATFYTEEFKIVNKGNLHLNYTILITGIDGNAKLNEVMEWGVVAADTNTSVYNMSGSLAPGAATDLMRLMGHMSEDATNEYQGLSMDGIIWYMFFFYSATHL